MFNIRKDRIFFKLHLAKKKDKEERLTNNFVMTFFARYRCNRQVKVSGTNRVDLTLD